MMGVLLILILLVIYVKNKWNNIYKNEKETYQYYNIFEPHENMAKVISDIKNKIPKKTKDIRVLDVGCGVGRNTLPLIEAGFDVYAFDSAPEGIKILQDIINDKNKKAHLDILDFTKELPYETDFFDVVISVQVLQHGYEEEIKSSIEEISRVLNSNGIIFITLCGRKDKDGKLRYTLVKTAKKVANHTFIPTIGNEKDMPHFIYNKQLIRKHFERFKIYEMWKDQRNYYCFLGKLK